MQAKTGTGKTIAFLLPAIQKLLKGGPRRGQVAILVLSPTRELALQIAAEAERLVTSPSCQQRPIQIHTAFGGTGRASNLNKFRSGNPTILVATPGVGHFGALLLPRHVLRIDAYPRVEILTPNFTTEAQ